MSWTKETGRRGTRGALVAVPLVGVLAVGAVLVGAIPGSEGERLPGHDAPSTVVIAPPQEPGERLVVRGRVFAPDGETPVEGVTLYVYHTNVEGRYAPPGEETPRLRSWVRTDAEGRYEYRTIRPGSYPGRDIPAHVHVFLWGAGYEPPWSDSRWFADDPLVDEEAKARSRQEGRLGRVCFPERTSEGALLCHRDYRLKPEGDDFPEEVRHAFQGPEGS
ncbi:MAG: protocatechuate 3,4-dioxygenase [Thermoanaerobaculia bacterium]|nr:protocatechuate 3,4-dioxygenase [Thermoanaerobaculia bacterium]